MNRVVKLAAAAALGGVLAAVLIVSATRPPAQPVTTLVYVPDEEAAPDIHAEEMKRCRTITMPETTCDAVWEAERRRFFREESQNK